MKKTVLSLFAASALLVSCSNNGNEAATDKAQEIQDNKTEATVSYSKIVEGSSIAWRASHLGGVQKRWGQVFLKSAEIQVTDSKVSNATVVIDLPSLIVENFDDEKSKMNLEGHLKNEDFFNVTKYPTSTFELSSITSTEGDYNSKVTGNLTILDSTKSITFSANVMETDSSISIKSEDFSVDRLQWGLKYNTEGTEGVPMDYLIADDIGFTIDVSLVK